MEQMEENPAVPDAEKKYIYCSEKLPSRYSGPSLAEHKKATCIVY